MRTAIVITCLALAALFMWMAQAHAHDWYTDKRDPVSRASCCGGSDCAMWTIKPGNLAASAEGYHVRLSVKETQAINKYSIFPIDAIVPWERVQDSQDGNCHLCIAAVGRAKPAGGVFCLFAPPNT